MTVKSYYAPTVEAAMASALAELGPEAVLITSRLTEPNAQHLGQYEVVFGTVEDSPGQQTAAEPVAAPVEPTPGELDCVRRELAGIRRALHNVWRTAPHAQWTAEMNEAEALLSEAELPVEIREALLDALEARLRDESAYNLARAQGERRKSRIRPMEPGGNTLRVASFLRESLAAMIAVNAEISADKNGRSILAFAGPSGSGKTTTLVKLAMRYGLSERRSTMIVSTDTYRVAATEQLRVYAATLGVPFELAEDASALQQILAEHGGKRLVLIDTGGAAPADADAIADTARLLAQHPGIDVHLVLPACHSARANAQAIERFSVFGPSRVILSKTDEAEISGAVVGQAILSGLPISFVTSGQRIPDDIAPAEPQQLLGFLDEPAAPSKAYSAA